MVAATSVRAVLFVKDLNRVTAFYTKALGMTDAEAGERHAVLKLGGFELIVHQIPEHIAAEIRISDPPLRREAGAVRLDYPVESIGNSRTVARSLGGSIDEDPPAWADRDANFYLGNDPEGNVFGVSQQPRQPEAQDRVA